MTGRHPALTLTVVPSRAVPGALSVRVGPDHSSPTFRRALAAAGFCEGDRVTLALESDGVLSVLARSFIREIEDGVTARDPVAFVARWTSVARELASQ